MKRIAFLILMTISLFGTVGAATPEYFVARGRVVNKKGKPVPGTYEVRATLWNDADAFEDDVAKSNEDTEANALWTENHIVQLMDDGRFEIRVGNELVLPEPFSFDTYQYLQLEVKKSGKQKYHIMDPLPFHEHIDRVTLVSLPRKEKMSSSSSGTTSSDITIGTNPGDVPVLNENGELSESVIPVSLRTTLSGLQSDVASIDVRVKENTNNIQDIQTDMSTITEEWDNKLTDAIRDNNYESASLITNLTSRLDTLETTVSHQGDLLSNYVENIETTVNNLLQDTYATKEEVNSLTAEGLDSSWKEVLYAGGELASNEDSSIGDIQFIVDEKKLASFDGNGWNRIADQTDLDAVVEKTVQKTFYFHDEILDIERNKSAQAGVFYWDKDKSMYFVGMSNGSLRSLFTEGSGESPIADWIDFRSIALEDTTIQLSEDAKITQNATTGIKLGSTPVKKANCAMAFPDMHFHRSENKTFEAVFYTRTMRGQILLGLMDGETPPVNKELLANNSNTELGLYMYLKEESNLFYGQDEYGISSYNVFDLAEPWKSDTYYKMSFKVPSDNDLSSLITIVEVSKDDFDTPIKTIVNHESYFDGLSDTVKPFLFGSGNPNYSLVAIRTY